MSSLDAHNRISWLKHCYCETTTWLEHQCRKGLAQIVRGKEFVEKKMTKQACKQTLGFLAICIYLYLFVDIYLYLDSIAFPFHSWYTVFRSTGKSFDYTYVHK